MSQHVDQPCTAAAKQQPGFLRWKFGRPGRVVSSLLTITVVAAALTAIDFLGAVRPDMVLNASAAVLINFVADGFKYYWEMTGQKKSLAMQFATILGAGFVTILVLAIGLKSAGM